MDTLLSYLDPKAHALIVLAATVIAAASVIAKALELVVAALSALWPDAAKANGPLNAVIAFLSRLQAMPILQGLALNPLPGAPSHPQTAAPAKPPVSIATGGAISLVLLGLLAFAAPARAQSGAAAPVSPGLHAAVAPPASTAAPSATLPPIDWKTVTFQHGPSLPLIVIDPKNPHPVEVAPGAGYYAGICFGQLVVNGAHVSLLCASAQAFLSVIAPRGTPEGGVQFAPMFGLFSNAIAGGPLLTPWTANGEGFLQLGRPGTDWAVSADLVTIWHLAGGL